MIRFLMVILIILVSFCFGIFVTLLHYYGLSQKRAEEIENALLEEYTRCPQINPFLVLGVILTESSFKNVYGDQGKAVGYMQLHTGAINYVASFYKDVKTFARKINHDYRKLIQFPVWQIKIGYRYLCMLYKYQAEGDIITTLWYYNGDLTYAQRVLLNTAEIMSVYNELKREGL